MCSSSPDGSLRIVPFCLAIKSDLAGQIESHREVASSVRINFPQAGRAALPGIESQRHGNSPAEGVCSREGFCQSSQVLAVVPTTPNPAIYGLHLYQTCTFSVPFRRKTARNGGCDGEPVFARANPQAGAAGR
jgi:hypothetical protein